MKRLALLALLFLYGCGITGMVVLEPIDNTPPHIIVTEARISDKTATIAWKTNETSASMFELEGESVTFDESDRFKVHLSNLEPGGRYTYGITACDKTKNCDSYTGSFITKTNAVPITGMAAAEMPIRQYASLLFYGAFALIVLLITLNMAYQRASQTEISITPVNTRIKGLIGKAEKTIGRGRYPEAYGIYDQIRPLYEKLNVRTKAKHYDRIINIHQRLQLYANAQEANYLTDKYLAGTITKEEMERLRELLTS